MKLSPNPGLFCLLLAAVTVLVYWPVGHYEFVNYDDLEYVTTNAHVLKGLSLKNAEWAFTTGHASNWHPLTWLSHMLDVQLFEMKPGRHHLVSLGLHTMNTVLLFLALAQLTRAPVRSAVVAALFALHPLHVESVAWISERKDVLSAFFFFLLLWSYGRYAQGRSDHETKTSAAPPPLTVLWFALTLVFYALGLMSKPMLVTVPFLLLLLDYWPLGRITFSWKPANRDALIFLILEKVPFLALSLASSVITFVVQRHGGAVSTSISVAARFANALVSYARYLGKTFWPAKLSILYPHPGQWPVLQVVLSGMLLVVLSVLAIVATRRRPWIVVGWFWFVGMLVPVIGVIQVGIQSMADRYTYLPLIGVFLVVVWSAGELLFPTAGSAEVALPSNPLALAALPLGILALAALAMLSRFQVRYWQNSETLFQHAVEVTKSNYLAYNNLGFYLSGQGRVDEAMENYRKSIEINPNYEDAQNNLGYALAGQKKYLEAIEHYNVALRASPKNAEVHNNLGNALAEIGRTDEAIEHYLVVLAQNPDHADAHNNLGIALAMKGRLPEAIPHFQEAIRLKPAYASAHSNLGNAYAALHRLEEAVSQYDECLRLNPSDSQAQNNLANVFVEQGKLDQAISHYTEALRLNHDNPEAHYNFGLVLLRQSKPTEAREHFSEALRLRPDYLDARRQLELLQTSPGH